MDNFQTYTQFLNHIESNYEEEWDLISPNITEETTITLKKFQLDNL